MGMRAHRIAIGLIWLALFGAAGRLGAQADGSVRWGGGFKAGGIVDASPAVAADGTVYVAGWDETNPPRGRILAITPAGALKWQFPAKPTDPQLNAVESSPAIGTDGTVYFGCGDGKIYALDGASGALKGSFDTGAAEIFSSPAVDADGGVYVVSSDQVLHALTRDLRPRWTHAAGALLAIDSTVAIGADGTLYFGAPDQSVYALGADGVEKWRADLGASVISSPAIGSDGTIYVGTGDNNLVAVSPRGDVKWRFLAGDLILAQPSIAADGSIYFGCLDGQFYALKPDRSLRWKLNLRVPVVSTAAVRADGTVIFGANDSLVHAVSPVDGATLWTFTTQDVVQTSPAIAADGTIYVGSFDGKIYALNGSGSPLSKTSSWPMLNRDATHSGRANAATAGAYLVNLSTRALAGGGANLIAGFVVQGQAAKRYLIRAVGPSLTLFGVPDPLADPAVSLVADSAEVAANDNWSSPDANFLSVLNATNGITFPLGSGEKDAALATLLAPGNYTAVVKLPTGGAGVVLVEAYDTAVASTAARLVNLSTRAQSGAGLFAGFVVGGQGTLRVLLRAIGPGLIPFGVGGVLVQPAMRVFDAKGNVIGANTGWNTGGVIEDIAAAARLSGAFPLQARSADSAVVMTLTPGAYTIQVAGADGGSGEALVEVYVVP